MPTSNPPSELPFSSNTPFDPTMPSWDNNYDPEFDFLNAAEDDGHVIHGFGSTEVPYADPKSLLPSLSDQISQPPLPSPPTHRGSSSSLSSSSRTSSEANRNGISPEPDLNSNDIKSSASLNGGTTDLGLPNPISWNTLGMDQNDNYMDKFLDFDNAGHSPSPSHQNSQLEPTPAKKHKTSHKELSSEFKRQSMRGKKIASREVSPTVNWAGHNMSPNTAFTRSPSAENPLQFFTSPTANPRFEVWANGFLPDVPVPQPQPLQTNPPGLPFRAHSYPDASLPPTLPPGPQPRLVVHSTPAKSRVETQIPIKLTIHHLPPGIKRLHLPTHTISKPKLLAKGNGGRSPDMLELQTQLVCSSAMLDVEKRRRAMNRAANASFDSVKPKMDHGKPADEGEKVQNGGEVRICAGCITRERKRAGRKKHKKPEEELLWDNYEHERAIVFNTQEIKDWVPVTSQMADPTGSGSKNIAVPEGTYQVDCPMRIACYCRHHQEKVGFQVIFTIKDTQGNLIAQETSSSIMITDDHKTPDNNQKPTAPTHMTNPAHIANALGKPQPSSGNDANMMDAPPLQPPPSHTLPNYASGQPPPDMANSNASMTYGFATTAITTPQPPSVTHTPVNLSRQGSPTCLPQASTRKRKLSGNSSKLPNGLLMTKIDEPAQLPGPPATQNEQSDPRTVANSTSPFTSRLPDAQSSADSQFGLGQQSGLVNIQGPFGTNPPTPNANEPFIFFQSAVTPGSSRTHSPNSLSAELQNLQGTQAAIGALSSPATPATTRQSSPLIYKVIPAEGPKSGGIEVTILGQDFSNGLEVMFGDFKAATTTFWGETSLVCMLPPSHAATCVPVTIRNPSNQPPTTPAHPPLFRYLDDDENQLMRTALKILGTKLGTDVSNMANTARQIISNVNVGGGSGWGNSQGLPPGSNTFNVDPKMDIETSLLRILETIDYDDSVNKARINLRRTSGQTMLHLACSTGFDRLVAGLLSRGASVNIQDKSGFTPLHMAVINDRPEIVRRLLLKGAEPRLRSLSGLSAMDVAQSPGVVDILQTVTSHSRSRSRGSRHSRAGSSSSLRSLWEPPSIARPQKKREEFLDDGDESSGFSSSDMDSSEEELWLAKRRGSQATPMRRSTLPDLPIAVDPASPTSAAVSAVREHFAAQFQQIQQSMNMHLQALSQFQMPNMPTGFPDYQSYLPQRPAIPRMTSLLPNMRLPRPEDRDQPAPDNRWSFFGSKDAPPPAYEDVFPRQDFDTKQASAAQAAVDFEADTKCATLFDQAETITTTNTANTAAATSCESMERTQQKETPTLLHVGRKKAITREQQETLQRAHAASLKSVQSDKMLWFVWIPFLILILGAMLVNCVPSIGATVKSAFESVAGTLPTPERAVTVFENAVRMR